MAWPPWGARRRQAGSPRGGEPSRDRRDGRDGKGGSARSRPATSPPSAARRTKPGPAKGADRGAAPRRPQPTRTRPAADPTSRTGTRSPDRRRPRTQPPRAPVSKAAPASKTTPAPVTRAVDFVNRLRPGHHGRPPEPATNGRAAKRAAASTATHGPSATLVGRLAARRRQELAGGDDGTLLLDLDWRTVATVAAAFVGLIVIAAFIRSVPRTMTAVAIGGLLALALNPVVVAIEQHLKVKRGVAVGMVLAGLLGLLALIATLLVPPAVRQARDLGKELPRVVRDLGNAPIIGKRLRGAHVPEKLDQWVRELPNRLAGDTTPLERVGRSALDGLVAAFVTLLLAFTLLVDGERLVRSVRRLIPRRRHEVADRVARLAYESVGRYVAGSIFVALIAGMCTLTAGLALGVPLTPLAAVNVSLFDLVPQIGGAAGGIPFVALGLTKSVGTGIACAVFFLVYLQVENHIIQPLVVGRTVHLSPPATMCAALIGVSAGGVVGALIAVPAVGAAKAVYLELRRPSQATDAIEGSGPVPADALAPGADGPDSTAPDH